MGILAVENEVVSCHVWDVSMLASTVCCDIYCQQCCIFVWFNKSHLKRRRYVLVTTEPALYYFWRAVLYSIEFYGSFVTNAYEYLHFDMVLSLTSSIANRILILLIV